MRYDSIANRMEINRLNNAISEEEQTISGLFQRIGQTYFAAHKDNPEPSQVGYVRAVLEAMERGKYYKEQINRVRGIAICPNPACMAEVPIDSAFCNRCGTRMPTAAAAEPEAAFDPNPGFRVCPSCGNHCAATQRFCNRCGGMLTGPETAPAPSNAAPAPMYTASAPERRFEAGAPAEPTPAPMYTASAPEPPASGYDAPAPEPPVFGSGVPAPGSEPVQENASAPMPEPPFAATPVQTPTPVPSPEIEAPAAAAPAAPTPSELAAAISDRAPAEEPIAPASAPVPEAPVFVPRTGRKFCPNCGTELAADSAFCLECGRPV